MSRAPLLGNADARPRIHLWQSKHPIRAGFYFSFGPNRSPWRPHTTAGAAIDNALEQIGIAGNGHTAPAIIIWESVR